MRASVVELRQRLFATDETAANAVSVYRGQIGFAETGRGLALAALALGAALGLADGPAGALATVLTSFAAPAFFLFSGALARDWLARDPASLGRGFAPTFLRAAALWGALALATLALSGVHEPRTIAMGLARASAPLGPLVAMPVFALAMHRLRNARPLIVLLAAAVFEIVHPAPAAAPALATLGCFVYFAAGYWLAPRWRALSSFAERAPVEATAMLASWAALATLACMLAPTGAGRPVAMLPFGALAAGLAGVGALTMTGGLLRRLGAQAPLGQFGRAWPYVCAGVGPLAALLVAGLARVDFASDPFSSLAALAAGALAILAGTAAAAMRR